MIVIVPKTDWTAVVTALGTVAVASVALGIAILSERRTNKRLRVERERSDQQIVSERMWADQRLKDEQAHSEIQQSLQRAHGDAQLAAERQLVRDAEQLAEAYLVQVTAARMSAEAYGSRVASEPDVLIECPVVIVADRGRYTITRVEAQLCLGGNSIMRYGKSEHFSSYLSLPAPLAEGLSGPERDVRLDTLTPVDLGLRFCHDAIDATRLHGAYPIVRWRDRWGTCWQHRLGLVEKIEESAPWNP